MGQTTTKKIWARDYLSGESLWILEGTKGGARERDFLRIAELQIQTWIDAQPYLAWNANKSLIIQKKWSEWTDRLVESKRADIPVPYVRSDYMPETISPVDGKEVFTSKSAWEKHIQRNGLTIVGNEKIKTGESYAGSASHSNDIKNAVHEAWDKVEQGYKPAEPEQKVSDDDFKLPADLRELEANPVIRGNHMTIKDESV